MDSTDSQPIIVRTGAPPGAAPPTPAEFRAMVLTARLRHAERSRRFANITMTPSDRANLAASLRADVAAMVTP